MWDRVLWSECASGMEFNNEQTAGMKITLGEAGQKNGEVIFVAGQ